MTLREFFIEAAGIALSLALAAATGVALGCARL